MNIFNNFVRSSIIKVYKYTLEVIDMAIDTAYCACSTEKTKTRAHMSGKFEHTMRLHPVTNADPNKRDQNEILIGDDNIKRVFQLSMEEAKKADREHKFKTYADYADETKKMVEEATGRKVRKDAVLEVEVVLTYSSSAQEGMDLDKWKEANVQWLKDYFGEENIVSAVLHMDETTPHIHAMVTPIDRTSGEPRFNAKKWLGGRALMSQMQDSYGKAMQEFGLHRGEKNSKAKHRDLQEFYRALNNVVRQKPPKREEFKTEVAYQAAIDDTYEQMRLRLFALEETIRRLEEIDETREKNDSLYRKIADARIKDYEEQIQILQSDLSEAEKKVRFVDHLQLAINDMEHQNPDAAQNFKDRINNEAKKGGRIAAAMERKRQLEEQKKDADKNDEPDRD